MRLWSLHPKHLDARGLVALWREGLLARAVLSGATRGYRHHPQLERFRRCAAPLAAIDAYLRHVGLEADARGYRFDRRKLGPTRRTARLPVHDGQLAHEWKHLLAKLRTRDPARWRELRRTAPTSHPCFRVIPGGVEAWERPAAPAARPPRSADRRRRRPAKG